MPTFSASFDRPHQIQPALKIHAAHDDIHEQAADRAADQVMRSPQASLQSSCSCGGGCPSCGSSENSSSKDTSGGKTAQPLQGSQLHIQLKASAGFSDRGNAVSPIVQEVSPIVQSVATTPGQALDLETREFMASRFNHDFSHVRVHTDEHAVAAARSLNAQAYTLGQDLVFATGQYAPQTYAGRHLIAHELSHVIQQQAAAPRIQMRRWGEGEMPPMTGEAFRASVMTAALALVSDNAPTLESALRRVLEGEQAIASLVAVLDDAERRSVGMTHTEQLAFITQTAALVVRTFILSANTSSIDLLPAAQRDRFRNFDWQRQDYPGGVHGANEARANQLSRRLSAIRPERRANSGGVAVVTRAQHTREVEQHIRDNLVAIPAFPTPADGSTPPNQRARHRLYRNAQAAFLTMRTAALADGIPLIVLSSYRNPAVARRRAAAADNPAAVASFSSHSLGLAVDLRMSFAYTDPGGRRQNLRFAETSTRPMQNVVDMRESPIHKWMFLHGAEHGWFPYQNEPWHWEYNPEGFRDQFNQALHPTQPQPGTEIIEEPEQPPA